MHNPTSGFAFKKIQLEEVRCKVSGVILKGFFFFETKSELITWSHELTNNFRITLSYLTSTFVRAFMLGYGGIFGRCQ